MNYRPVLVAFDLETTGLSPYQDEIIEIGAVKIEDGKITQEFQTLIRPSRPIPPQISQLTGITQDQLDDAPPLREVLPGFLDFLDNYPLIAHQAVFDQGFLEANLGYPLSNEVLDTLELARLAFPRAINHRLATLARELGFPQLETHRALDDARAAAHLFIAIDQKLKDWEPEQAYRINQIAASFNWSLAGYFRFLENYLTRNALLNPNRAGYTPLAPMPFTRDDIISSPGEGTKKDVDRRPLDIEYLESLLGPDGPVGRYFRNYEYRTQQLIMLSRVAVAFNRDHHLAVEAGTGTGKSLAYLLPALFFAILNREKVVVSTHTITLQEQLWFKDIPKLRDIISTISEEYTPGLHNFKVALVKGRSNYLCLRKWHNLEQTSDYYTPEESKFFIRLIPWLRETTTGDRSELNLHRPVADAWSLVAAESESCLGAACPWNKEQCFVMRARRECEEAHLLVVNHSLLLADFKTENQILPEYNRLIIDEAHHLEESATRHLGIEVSLQELLKLGQGLYRPSRYGPTGFAVSLKNRWNRLRRQNDSIEWLSGERKLEDLLSDLEAVKERAETFFGIITDFVRRRFEEEDNNIRQTLRFRLELSQTTWWKSWIEVRNNLIFQISTLIDRLRALEGIIESIEIDTGIGINEKKDLQAIRQLYLRFIENLKLATGIEDENWVYWTEIEEWDGNYNPILKAAPIQVAELLNQYLFVPRKTVILTSATLAIGNSFNHFEERVGLSLAEPERVEMLQLDSPFDYEQQALLVIPQDLPNPVEVGDEKYTEAMVPVLAEILEATEGRAIVLFTSHQMLRKTYAQIREPLERKGIPVLGHNIDGGQSRLVDNFRLTPRSVIFGASTFWEGVDIQGDELSCIVIVKLPFLPPGMPVVEARLEAEKRRKRNGFYHYTLPEAILRLRQGFGRLIRSSSDRGVVVILDRRIIDKPYGVQFLRSLPLKTHMRANSLVLKEKIAKWLTRDV
ncbi:MAG: DEAD/DEAH box helicase family protein [Syntrophomonadaceae bacterium]|nr:DEAD/DEAH box helicase family protein [Syntrophomonadaceae bacterium]